jgi:peptidoglycan LD-endopeptidase LytH
MWKRALSLVNIFLTRSSCLLMGLALLGCGREQTEHITPSATATQSPKVSASIPPRPSVTPSISPSPRSYTASASFIIPVLGVRAEQLHDTFNEARSEGRVHEAIDILAPHETHVVAAANGTIVKLFTSEKGGITIYQLSSDQSLVLYYAHLDRYADGLTEQQEVRQGDLLGYVGDTGNAQPGNYHLHFAVWEISDPKRFWTGVNLNPYELLRGANR